MTKETAQKLDEVLKTFPPDKIIHVFQLANKEELFSFLGLVDVLKNDGYVIPQGGMGCDKVVSITPTGRNFIGDGGYTAQVEREESAMAKETFYQEVLMQHIAKNEQTQEKQKEEFPKVTILFLVIAAILFFFYYDSNSEFWKNITGIVGLLSALISIVSYIASTRGR